MDLTMEKNKPYYAYPAFVTSEGKEISERGRCMVTYTGDRLYTDREITLKALESSNMAIIRFFADEIDSTYWFFDLGLAAWTGGGPVVEHCEFTITAGRMF